VMCELSDSVAAIGKKVEEYQSAITICATNQYVFVILITN